MVRRVAVFGAFLVFSLMAVVGAQDRTVRDNVYTTAQAERGSRYFAINCEACHGSMLEGGMDDDGNEAPALKRDNFAVSRKTLGNLFTFVSTMMPKDKPGELSATTYADIFAFILQQNGFPSGDKELPSTFEALNGIQIVGK